LNLNIIKLLYNKITLQILIPLINYIVDFIFPKTCIVTGNRLDEKNSNDYVEDEVMQSINEVTSNELKEMKSKVASDYAYTLYDFTENSPLQQIIHHFKYRGMKKLGIYLGELIGKELINNFYDTVKTFDVIIPVPLYKTKERERGYNQAEYLCKGINNQIQIEFIKDLVERTRHTKSQTKLSQSERIENVKDAFEINKNYKGKISGKRIILVDDVVTTGSTLNEIIKELRTEDVSQIFVVTAAMAKK